MGAAGERKRGTDAFPTTNWAKVSQVADPDERQVALDFVARRYWTPVYSYLLSQGFDPATCQDLTQEFFAFALSTNALGRARRERGKFRAFLLTCLKNFIANQRRAASSQARAPSAGLTALEDMLESGAPMPAALVDNNDAERVFHRIWVQELIRNTLTDFEADCYARGRPELVRLFQSFVVAPILDGAARPSLSETARDMGLTYKETANLIVTAKRGFLRLLRAEVSTLTKQKDERDAEECEALTLLSFDSV